MKYYETFEVKEIHLKLLQAMYIEWNDEYDGSPMVDSKRPYGNSDVADDVFYHLHGKYYRDTPEAEEHDEMGTSVYNQMLKYHRETEKALQILTSNLSIKLGTYGRPEQYDTSKWVKINE